VKKEIPGDPGGRDSVQGSPQEQNRRIKQVLSFIEKGMKVTDALKRVARKENISLSTMQRVWRKRTRRNGPEDTTLTDTKSLKPHDAS
jgi:DNA invertase Pin-like site-specific DNA recombinase